VEEIEVPVLIAGGSLVGMSTALLLGHHGVRCLVVEYHRGTAIHPRAAQTTQRTMEIFRGLGIEQVVQQRSEQQFVQDGGVLAVETLIGGVTDSYIADLNAGVRDVSPCVRVFLTQSALEPLLKTRAEELGAQLRFATELVSFEQDPQGVTALLRHRDAGKTTRVRAKYMVAADGAHSRVRERLGIGMSGHGTFSNSITIYFRAELAALLADKKWAVVYANNQQLRGFFRFEKPFDRGFLVVNTIGDPQQPDSDVSRGLTDEGALKFVRTALGTDAIPVTVESVMRWGATADFANTFGSARVFLAGDAAHVMPPNGGFGGNTGVQDAHNLAWKLALVLNDAAGAQLLATYDAERRPASTFTVEQAYTRYVVRTNPALGTVGMQPAAPDLNIEMGYIYQSAAVIPEDPADRRGHENPRESRGRPGTRAPHVWLQRGGQQISTLDLFGRNFVLLAAPGAGAWCASARAAAQALSIALDAHEIGAAGLTDPAGGCTAAYGIEPRRAVLVRPDGFVAWRSAAGATASTAGVVGILQSLLQRAA
jgi:2-polyprenyl-6-methoxyphenol hydroxylase-like FAD-dependent oxidoreductase